mmetsp:Transcript_1300/g.5098  ORF Transcript_1300/g.5098 Transcript_1300/m.5098 type:complete len:276 (-) Transcript_1300:287-1114(-)
MVVILDRIVARFLIFVIFIAVTHAAIVLFFILLVYSSFLFLRTLLPSLIPPLRRVEVIPAAGQTKVWVCSRLRAVVASHASFVALHLPRRMGLLEVLGQVLRYPRRDPDASANLRRVDRDLTAETHGAELVVRVEDHHELAPNDHLLVHRRVGDDQSVLLGEVPEGDRDGEVMECERHGFPNIRGVDCDELGIGADRRLGPSERQQCSVGGERRRARDISARIQHVDIAPDVPYPASGQDAQRLDVHGSRLANRSLEHESELLRLLPWPPGFEVR